MIMEMLRKRSMHMTSTCRNVLWRYDVRGEREGNQIEMN